MTREHQDRALKNSARETKIVIRPQPQHIEESKKNVFLRHPYALRWRSVELFKKRTIVVITDYLIVGVSLLPSVLILFTVAPKKYQLSKSNNWNWSTFDLRLTDRSLEISFFIKLNFLLFETENRKGKTDNATYKLEQPHRINHEDIKGGFKINDGEWIISKIPVLQQLTFAQCMGFIVWQ